MRMPRIPGRQTRPPTSRVNARLMSAPPVFTAGGQVCAVRRGADNPWIGVQAYHDTMVMGVFDEDAEPFIEYLCAYCCEVRLPSDAGWFHCFAGSCGPSGAGFHVHTLLLR